MLEAASGEKVLPVGKSKGGIVVRGIHDVAVRFSKCCNPIPGDEIVGFVTRGRGVTIHRTDCVNVLNLPESERARLIDAEWQAEDNGGSLLYRGDQRLRKQPYRSSGGYLQDLYRAEDRPCGDERENEQAGNGFHRCDVRRDTTTKS